MENHMAVPMQTRRYLAMAAGLLLGGAVVLPTPGASADTEPTTISGRVRVVEGGSVPDQPNADVTVTVVDGQGWIVATQSTGDAFQLAVPSDGDYALMISHDGEDLGVLVWGDDERSEFVARGGTIDLGYVGLNPTTRRAYALRELDLRAPRHRGDNAGSRFVREE
jgi:hypothetical protein